MNIKSLRLKNFLSHTDSGIQFTNDGIYVIVGQDKETGKSIGSGKSSIVDAINFVLYGASRNGLKNSDDLIKKGTKETKVGLSFELNGVAYTVIRTKSRKSSQLVIKRNGSILDMLSSDAQTYINKLLGADYQIFRSTAYFKQGDLDAFSKLSPKESKELLMQILQLSIYDKYAETVKDDIRKTKEQILDLDHYVDVRNEIIQKLKEEKKEADIPDTKKLELSIKTLKQVIAQETEKQVKEEKAYEEFIEKALVRENTMANLEGQVSTFQKRQKTLKKLKDKCPLCGTSLTDEQLQEIIDELAKTIATLRKEIAFIEVDKTGYRNKARQLPIATRKQKIREHEETIREQNEVLIQARTEKKEIKAKQEKIDLLLHKIKRAKEDLKKLDEILVNYDTLLEVFGKNGIQACIIENLIPEIQATTNTILQKLDDYLYVSLRTTKNLKSGKQADTLQIIIQDREGERPYINYSGGEKTLIDFALRISLSIVLSQRANAQIQTLILDECFNQLDRVGRDKMVGVIQKIGWQYGFKKILVISHCEEIQEIDGQVIKVVKDTSGSRIL